MKSIIAAAVLVLIALPQAAVRADDKDKATSDADFLNKSSACCAGEVKINEYAAKHASDERVRDFADRLMKDHKVLNTTFTENAKRMNVTVLPAPEKEIQARIDKLATLKGAEFDTAYLQQVIDNHEKAISLFESEAKIGENADLKRVVTDNLPLLKKHLEQAKQLLAQLKKN